MIELIRFLVMAWRAYRSAKSSGRPYYSAVLYRDVPQVCIYVAVGREAWRVSQIAIEEFRL